MPELKKKDTRFKKGQTGNPLGRPKGSKNKRKDILNKMDAELDKGAVDVLKVAIARAKRGDHKCMKMVLDRCYPVQKAVDGSAQKGAPTINIVVESIKDITSTVEVIDETPEEENSENA